MAHYMGLAAGLAAEPLRKKAASLINQATTEIHDHVASALHGAANNISSRARGAVKSLAKAPRALMPRKSVGKSAWLKHQAPARKKLLKGKGHARPTAAQYKAGGYDRPPASWISGDPDDHYRTPGARYGPETMAWKDPYPTSFRVDTELKHMRTRPVRGKFHSKRRVFRRKK